MTEMQQRWWHPQDPQIERFNAALFRLRVSTKRMSALEALTAVSDWLNEADSFVETFDHDGHGDEIDADLPGECRFDSTELDRGMTVLNKLIEAAERVLSAEEHPTHFELDEALDDLFVALNGATAEEILAEPAKEEA